MKIGFRLFVALVGALALGPAAGGRAVAQEPARGAVSGRVVDAETGQPLGGATVAVAPEHGGALPAGSGSALLPGARSAVTDSTGSYRVDGLGPGRYRVYFQRLGYRPAALEVEMRNASDPKVSVALEVEPVSLAPLEIEQEPAPPYGRAAEAGDDAGAARVAAERLRQRDYLAGDVRSLTHADVLEAVTLGETDLFRGLQRLPGVATRDDYSAELWTRGAGWDQTRVTFDGLPLFNPLHGFGVLSGVSPDALGAALLHPGVRPASAGEGGAAVVALETRRGAGDGELRGSGDLSLASARLAMDQTVLDGRGAWMLAGRRTYLDWLTRGVERLAGGDDIAVPYSFADLAGRGDYRLDDDRALEVGGLWSQDRVTGDIPDVLQGNRARWGNALGRLTLSAPIAGARARHTVGVSRYGAAVTEAPVDPALGDGYAETPDPPSDNSILYATLATELEPAGADAVRRWRAGAGLVYQDAAYDGPAPRPFAGDAAADAEPLAVEASVGYATLWGELRWPATDRLSLEAGLRAESGETVRNGGTVRLAPRLAARFAVSPAISLSAALGRAYQYSQALAPAGVAAHGALFNASSLWLLAGDTVPALRTDVATLGAEAWLGRGWLASASAYARRGTGVVLPDPTPGALSGRPLFVEGVNTAWGAELGARRLAGRWTASAAYSYGVSEIEAAGLRFASPAERRHVLDATTMFRLGESWRLGAAYTAMSGAPFTRVLSHHYTDCDADGWCTESYEPTAESPSGARTPAYASLDLLAEWTRRFGTWDLALYAQVRNALFRDNAAGYSGSSVFCWSQAWQGERTRCRDLDGQVVPLVQRDTFEQGLPILPLVGARIGF